MLFFHGAMLALPGQPGFPWEWDAFGGGPGKNGGSADASLYPVSDGTPHAKQKVRDIATSSPARAAIF